jgi:hypothetical protein
MNCKQEVGSSSNTLDLYSAVVLNGPSRSLLPVGLRMLCTEPTVLIPEVTSSMQLVFQSLCGSVWYIR